MVVVVNIVPCAPLQFDANGDREILTGGAAAGHARGSWETSSRPRRSPSGQEADINGDGTVTLKVMLCRGDRHPHLPQGDFFFSSWPFLLILPQFEVGGGRVRFWNCLLSHFLPMSFPKHALSPLPCFNICTWPSLEHPVQKLILTPPFPSFLVPWAPLS